MATAEHVPAVTTVTVPERFNLSLSSREADLLATLIGHVAYDHEAGREINAIREALARAGADDVDLSITSRPMLYSADSVTIIVKEN